MSGSTPARARSTPRRSRACGAVPGAEGPAASWQPPFAEVEREHEVPDLVGLAHAIFDLDEELAFGRRGFIDFHRQHVDARFAATQRLFHGRADALDRGAVHRFEHELVDA